MIIRAIQAIFGEVNLQVGETADVRDELAKELISINAAIEIDTPINKKVKK